MKRLVPAIAAFLLSSSALAALPNTYQVTGPIVELTDTTITVMKGKEKWQLARDPSTKVAGDLKVGAKVTIEYRMSATKIDVKEGGKKK